MYLYETIVRNLNQFLNCNYINSLNLRQFHWNVIYSCTFFAVCSLTHTYTRWWLSTHTRHARIRFMFIRIFEWPRFKGSIRQRGTFLIFDEGKLRFELFSFLGAHRVQTNYNWNHVCLCVCVNQTLNCHECLIANARWLSGCGLFDPSIMCDIKWNRDWMHYKMKIA